MKYIWITLFIILALAILGPFLGKLTEGVSNMSGRVITDASNNTTVATSNPITSNTAHDNYNHFTGTSNPNFFYGPDGSTAQVTSTGNATTIVVTKPNGNTDIYYVGWDTKQSKQYYGPNGSNASISTDASGNQFVRISNPNGADTIYTNSNPALETSYDPTINNVTSEMNSTGQSTASNYQTAFEKQNIYTNSNPALKTSYDPTINNVTSEMNSTGKSTASNYQTAFEKQNICKNVNSLSSLGTNYDASSYASSNPTGIPKNQIIPGEEDLYILKSQVVPPVCPMCPTPIIEYNPNDGSGSGSKASTCPPCPACARCPEPAFDCKKVPNYSSFNPSGNGLPIPVLNDFSTFGM